MYIFTVNVPGGERGNEKMHAQLGKSNFLSILLNWKEEAFFDVLLTIDVIFEGKEIQLRHRAPVIGISILNLGNKLLHVQESGDRHAPHYALISSEEQIKVSNFLTDSPS